MTKAIMLSIFQLTRNSEVENSLKLLPGSPMPVTCVLSLVTSLTVGVTGDVVSFTSITFSSDLLPDGSVDVTLIPSPVTPTVSEVTSESTQVTGIGEPGSTVKVELPNGTELTGLLTLFHSVIPLLPYFLVPLCLLLVCFHSLLHSPLVSLVMVLR